MFLEEGDRIQSLYNISYIMSRTQSKIVQHIKKQKNMTHSQEKSQSKENDFALTQILGLADKDLKQQCS